MPQPPIPPTVAQSLVIHVSTLSFRQKLLSKGRAMKVFVSSLLLGCIFTALGCATDLPPEQHQALEALPPGMQTVVDHEPPAEQQKFLSMPAEKRSQIVKEWQRREDIMKTFTPAERMAISSMSPADQDKFFAMPKDKAEKFLAERTRYNHEALINCQTLTHRRFGEFVSGAAGHEEQSKRFTPAEQAIISGLSPEQSEKFFSLPADQQESFLTDTMRNNTEQLISCMTLSHRHLGDAP
jgi:hypothetical protein